MSHPFATAPYADSLPHVGKPLSVAEWGGHVLTRATPCGAHCDALGPYPLTPFAADADLAGGLDRLNAAGLVSVVLVVDHHLSPPAEDLIAAFDVARPFKSHHIYDRRLGPPAYNKHHRYEIRRASARVEVREIVLADHLPAWEALYAGLVARHDLSGLHAFPRAHHEALAALAGVRTFGAFLEGAMVSAHVFVAHGGYAVSHLAASSPDGYRNGAAYAVNALAIEALTDCEAINFGGGAGAADDQSDGLVRFKKGFSNRIASSWICGAVLDQQAYRTLSGGEDEQGFFPAYRRGRKVERSDEHQG